jgi:hypothetical protein
MSKLSRGFDHGQAKDRRPCACCDDCDFTAVRQCRWESPRISAKNSTMTETKYTLSIPFRILCVVLGLTAVFMNMGNLAGDASSTGSTALQHSTQSCTDKLNELDHVFDQRREARAVFSRGKGEKWDWYEPEAVCLSEERFGSNSNQRYMAFQDGALECLIEFCLTFNMKFS